MEKIAILGGGVGALSAAFELTELDPNRSCYDITVYQVGWRLGGKGAVGRNVDLYNRVEEHGLHVWTGFYDNAFRLVDRVYDALAKSGKPVPFGGRANAFQPLDSATLMQQQGDAWVPWRFDLPRRAGTPGDADASEPTPVDYVQALLGSAQDWVPTQLSLLGFGPSGKLQQSVQEAADAANAMPSDPDAVTPQMREELRRKIETAHGALQDTQQQLLLLDAAPFAWASRPEGVLIELALALAKGLTTNEVFDGDFDALDDIDWSDWMRSNGCSDTALESAIVRACYDYVFAYREGRPNFAAGTGTRLLLKLLFGYKDAFFFVMRATMGELLFAPLYTVLRDRGVKFAFFHRVDRLVLSPDRNAIHAIEMTVQATPHGEYDPLISVADGAGGTLASWPSQPKFDDLQQGAAIRAGRQAGAGGAATPHDLESAWTTWDNVQSTTLHCGTDFDRVVLGIGLGAFPWICQDLIAAHLPWKKMVQFVRTTPTIALQLWTTCPTSALVPPADDTPAPAGGAQADAPSIPAPSVLSAFQRPLDSWGDLSLLLGQENWPGDAPEGLHYFVGTYAPDGPLPQPGIANPDFPDQQLAAAKAMQQAWVGNALGKLWSGWLKDGQLQWDLLFDPQGRQGDQRLAAQYARVNINPSDQYVQSVAGSQRFRLPAGGSGIANLYLAGDWVRTEINAGCVEAAVMAGRAAAAAITGMEIDMPKTNEFSDSGFANILLPGFTLLRELEHRASGGTGRMDGYCAVYQVPLADVRACLPAGVKLPGSGHTAQVVLVFARQRDVRPGLVPFGGLRYAEVFQVIPGVELEKSPDGRPIHFSFMPNLLLDSLVPVVVGQNAYGFNKRLARIRHSEGSFDVRSALGATSAYFTPTGVPGAIDDFPEIAAMRQQLQLPLIGLAPDGSFVVSHAHFELDGGSFQRVGGTIKPGAPFLAPAATMDLGHDPKQGPWGFRMQCRWRLSLPAGDVGRARPADRNVRGLVGRQFESLVGPFPVRRR